MAWHMTNSGAGHRATLVGVILVLSITTCTTGLARDRIEVEGESFVDSWNQGGMFIRISTCFNASGGQVADGLDVAGDWIELQVALPWTHCFADWIGLQGILGQTSTVRMTVFASGQPEPLLTSDFIFTGAGVE